MPGLLVYCVIYGVFHSGRSIAPEPPSANSIEAITLILLSSAVVHTSTAVVIMMNDWVCGAGGCPIRLDASFLDPYQRAFAAIENEKISGGAFGGLIGVALLQGLGAYFLTRSYLRYLAKADRLPSWIYGWATDIANAADNDEDLIVAYVLTTHDHDGSAIVYGGVLYDLALKPDGCISRITLWDCERYNANLSGALEQKTLPAPLSRFPFMMIEAAHIRNVAFEIVNLTDAA